MKISSLADGYKCFVATYYQHFQNKITTIIFHTFNLTDQRNRCHWNYERQGTKLMDVGINLSLIQCRPKHMRT